MLSHAYRAAHNYHTVRLLQVYKQGGSDYRFHLEGYVTVICSTTEISPSESTQKPADMLYFIVLEGRFASTIQPRTTGLPQSRVARQIVTTGYLWMDYL